MKKMIYMILAIALAGNSLQVQAQNSNPDPKPEYYAVYERAYDETIKHGVNPMIILPVENVEPGKNSLTIHFKQPVNGPAIVNIYDMYGGLIYNQYAELNGTSINIRENVLKEGKYFMHVFTESAENIYEFDINQAIN